MATSMIKQPNFRGMFAHTYETLSHAVTSGSSSTITKNITNAGWYPVCIVGWRTSGTMGTYLRVSAFTLTNITSGSATISMTFYNSGGSTSNGDIDVVVLWQRIA